VPEPAQPPEGYRIELFAEQDAVGELDVIDLWRRETGMPDEEAKRRIHELLLVATLEGRLAGVSSAYLQREPQLGMLLWGYRAFVAATYRMETIALSLALVGYDHLRDRFLSGVDRRASGVLYVVENEGLQQRFADAIWPRTDFIFIGENERGDHVRVRYFPGALAPDPPR
jgi:hypothetical protein